MRSSFILFFMCFILNKMYSQSSESDWLKMSENNNYFNTESLKVPTPFGTAIRSNIHYVGNNYHINKKDSCTQIINNETGVVNQEFDNVLSDKRHNIKKYLIDELTINFSSDDGWITYAIGQVYEENLNVTYFSSEYVVPEPPNKSSKQLIYLFSGLEGKNAFIEIVQPVLQWGVSPAGGGDFWSICNWYVSGSSQFFYDSLIKVSPGTRLKSVIKLTSTSDSLFSYYSSFLGYGTGLQINNISHLLTPFIALEGYNVQGCDEYPSDEKIKISDIQILHDTISPQIIWNSYDKISGCGQFTRIVNRSADKGQIDIHFHTPYSINNFNEIHIYPNPVENILHISPNYLDNSLRYFPDEPISNVKMELINSLGEVIRYNFYENLDHEFNLDMSKLEPGLYVLKFTYNNKSHSFKVIKQ